LDFKKVKTMSKSISVKTASGTKLYKVSESGNRFYCYRYKDSILGSWSNIGQARSLEDALNIIRSHAGSRYGHVYGLNIS